MIRGRVVGQVWATRKIRALEGRKLVLIGADDRLVVALDTLDARSGDEVTVSFGSGARRALDESGDRDLFADAAVSLIVDGEA